MGLVAVCTQVVAIEEEDSIDGPANGKNAIQQVSVRRPTSDGTNNVSECDVFVSVQATLVTLVATDGANYVNIRDAFVSAHSNRVQELVDIVGNTNWPWQSRAMAGILAEHIRRKNDIKGVIEKNWLTDPEYNKGWNRLRAGPGPGLVLLVCKRYREQALWYFFLEQVWKDTNEIAGNPLIGYPDVWRSAVRDACKESPVYDLMLIVVAERVKKDIGFRQYERWSELDFLLESTTNTVLSDILDIVEQAPLNNRNAAWRKMANTIAQPEDAPIIEKHFKDKGQEIPEVLVEPLKDLKERLKKKTEAK